MRIFCASYRTLYLCTMMVFHVYIRCRYSVIILLSVIGIRSPDVIVFDKLACSLVRRAYQVFTLLRPVNVIRETITFSYIRHPQGEAPVQVSTQQYRQQYRHSRWPQEVGRRRCLLREGPMCFRETLSDFGGHSSPLRRF